MFLAEFLRYYTKSIHLKLPSLLKNIAAACTVSSADFSDTLAVFHVLFFESFSHMLDIINPASTAVTGLLPDNLFFGHTHEYVTEVSHEKKGSARPKC